jgi:hypothetical protein
MTAIANALAILATTQTELTETLNQMDAEHKSRRELILAELMPLNKAIASLTGKSATPTKSVMATRKPMSEAGKENIRKALAARKANPAGSKVTEPVSVPSTPIEQPKTTVKTTAMERDVLVNGILKNNFQDGSDGTQQIWVDQILDNGSCKIVKKNSLPGVVASLSKKELVSTDGEGILLTETGLALAKELRDAE